MTLDPAPIRIVNSVAPMRICDNGGWSDTWFARYGKILNLAVYPFAEVQMRTFHARSREKRITIEAENYGDHYSLDIPRGCYDKHPLLEAAMDYMEIPEELAIEVSIYCEAPPGCSTGTSAAVSVALIGALDQLTPGRMTPHEVASSAHRIETELLGQQCGIQDQIASAYGGINFIDMHEYPHASVSQVRVAQRTWWELESRLLLVFVGLSHSSSKVHEMVIKGLEASGPDTPPLPRLRRAAMDARDALYAGDLRALGRSMIENTEAQRTLHPELIGQRHQQIIDLAREHDAWGWKVNGAGGDGGSVTILTSPSRPRKRVLAEAASSQGLHLVPIRLCRYGLRVWESTPLAPSEV
jgi:D-glycero-alpha-D-manno-heptose-7-phosphate kinase